MINDVPSSFLKISSDKDRVFPEITETSICILWEITSRAGENEAAFEDMERIINVRTKVKVRDKSIDFFVELVYNIFV